MVSKGLSRTAAAGEDLVRIKELVTITKPWCGLIRSRARTSQSMSQYRDTIQQPVPVSINVMDVLRGVARRKVMIAAMTFAALAGGAALANYLKPVYSTEAQVLVQNLETPFDRVQSQDNQRADGVDDRIVTSQMSVVKSEDLGRRVVAALGLENEPEFNSLLKGLGPVSKIKLAMGFGDDPRLKSPEQRALDHYVDELSVYQQPNSNVISIKYSAGNPEMAAKVANTLADIYVTWTRESQSQPTERAREWLSQQIDGLRKKLAASEVAVEKFRAEAGLLQGTSSTLSTQEISELNTQITVAMTASSEARARADSIRELLQAKGSIDSSPDVLASAAVQRLKEQRGEAARRVAELQATYLPNHPRMIAAQSELSNVDRQMRAEALKVVSSLEDQARVAEAREKSLRGSLTSLKTEKSSANLDDVKLKALERDVAADRVLLESLLSRYAEASARQNQADQPGLARIIQSAGVPASPSFPKRGPMVVLITIAGLSLSIGLAFLIELMSAASRLNEMMVEGAGPKLAQAAPRLPEAPPEPAWQPPRFYPAQAHLAVMPGIASAADAPMSLQSAAVTTAAQSIANWVAAGTPASKIKRVGISAIGAMAGDTSVASVAVARALSSMGKRVIIADLSRTGSWLLGICGVHPGAGFADLVSGTADFTKVIGRDVKSTVHVLRYGIDHSPRAAELIAERAESVLAALAQSYDVVIVHLGEAQNDTPVLLHKCEAALILAPAAHLNEASEAVQVLLSTGIAAARHILIGPPSTANGGAGAPALQAANA